MATEFVAVDGEALREQDVYVLLAASTGEHELDLTGLSSWRCLEFLLSLSKPGRRLVCFGLNYDVNQWLAGVSKPTLQELWRNGSATWRDYQLSWLPRRSFTVRQGRRSAKVTECWGFFQSSFTNALRAWGFDVPPELDLLKAKRASFTAAEIDRIVRYCHTECSLLVELMELLRDATLVADCEPAEWIGAGALASSMLRSHSIAEHHAHDAAIANDAGVAAIMASYFGGRIEAFRAGTSHRVSSADIRSAYPSAALELPSLAGARLRSARKFDPAAEHAIWRVRWRELAGDVMPFPVRRDFAIYYPRSGEGFYHACEVRAALAAGFELDVGGGYVLSANGAWANSQGPAPFAWVRDVYRVRERFKREGSAAELPLKLGLNSLYGKLAQGIGWRGRAPRWQSYLWAGEITARTRARVLEMLVATPAPLMAATDGVYALGNGWRSRRGLGGLESSRHDSVFVAQPGLYAARTGDRVTLGSRGHFVAELDYDLLSEGFESEGFDHVHHYNSRRFVGLGVALMRRDMRLWRRWPDEVRHVSLYPLRKTGDADGRLHPPAGTPATPSESEPYVPKGRTTLQDELSIENVQAFEQPMR